MVHPNYSVRRRITHRFRLLNDWPERTLKICNGNGLEKNGTVITFEIDQPMELKLQTWMFLQHDQTH